MPGLVLTGAALALAISQCAGANPPADLLTRIIMHESMGRTWVTNLNKNGTTDYGLAQINSTNLAWLGETPTTILDPCRNIAAEVRILRGFSSYATGSAERGFTLKPPGQQVSYVEGMADRKFRDVDAAIPAPAAPPPPRHQLVTIQTRRK